MRSALRLRAPMTLAAALLSSGCVDEGQPIPDGDVGAAELSLQLAPGLTLDSIGYTVTGPNGFLRSDSINLARSPSVSFTVGGLPAGNGYAISVTGTASDGATSCAGMATFNVMAKGTTTVMLHLLCREPPRTGSAKVVGSLNICPAVDALSASPNEVSVGGTIALGGAAHDSDSAPAAIVHQWTASAGSLVAAGASATFTCTAAGPATVTVTVTDGDCTDTATVAVMCTVPAVVRKIFARPSTLPDSNNEGIGIAPDSECSGGFKRFFWADDSHFAGHALRIDSIPCGPIF